MPQLERSRATSAVAVAGLSLAGMLSSPGAARAEPAAAARPLVVELFTSEGCSFCPPADALLGELAARRDVLALGFHVDYWDDLGWKDRFDLPLSAQRQAQYARRLHLQSVYTPQLVVDGREDVAGYDRRVAQLLVMPHTGVPVHLAVAGAELVVRVDAAVGTWQGAAVEWRVSRAALPVDATDVAVLLQRPDTGAMIGAASAPLPR